MVVHLLGNQTRVLRPACSLRQTAKGCRTHLAGAAVSLAKDPDVGIQAGNRHLNPAIRSPHHDRRPHDERYIGGIASCADTQKRGAWQTSRRVVCEPCIADQDLDPGIERKRRSIFKRHSRDITRRQAAGTAQRDHQMRQIARSAESPLKNIQRARQCLLGRRDSLRRAAEIAPHPVVDGPQSGIRLAQAGKLLLAEPGQAIGRTEAAGQQEAQRFGCRQRRHRRVAKQRGNIEAGLQQPQLNVELDPQLAAGGGDMQIAGRGGRIGEDRLSR